MAAVLLSLAVGAAHGQPARAPAAAASAPSAATGADKLPARRAGTGPDVAALPQPIAPRDVDLGRLSEGFGPGIAATLPQAGDTGPTLFVFVSFSMPRATLERLVAQAEKAKAVLVLRGFADGSLKDTVARAKDLLGQHQTALQIDPRAFARYGVSTVPTFVLARSAPIECQADRCAPSDDFVAISGDVTLDYALEQIRRHALSFSRDGAAFAERLATGRAR